MIDNEKNKLIPSRVATTWRVYMDYWMLDKDIRKDHFPIPFIDQMLDRVNRKEFYWFLDD